MTKARKIRPPLSVGFDVIVMPRVTADGVTVMYSDYAQPCIVCQLDSYTRVDGIALHTDRCLDRHRKGFRAN